MSVDRNVYAYFSVLKNLVVSVETPTLRSPTNPITNVTNGSLGYPAAYAIDTRSIVLK